MIGEEFETKNWGRAIVVSTVDTKMIGIVFLNTGNYKEVNRTVFYSGLVSDSQEKDRIKKEEVARKEEERVEKALHPKVYGKGFVGVGSYNPKESPELWNLFTHMHRRCYDSKYISRKYYEGCEVDLIWHNFQEFCRTVKLLDGYEEWAKFEKGPGGRNLYQLDKDIRFPGNKVYSPDTCQFVLQSENTSFATSKPRKGYRFVKDGKLIEVEYLRKWCEEVGLNHTSIRGLLNGLCGSIHGYMVYNPDIPLEDHKTYEPVTLKGSILGSVFKTNNHGNCVVVEYYNSDHVVVEFSNTGNRKKTYLGSLKRGTVRDSETGS